MADGRKIPYIIEMGINDEKLKRQMSQWDWEEIIGIKGFGKHFEKPAKEASDAIENAFANTSIDWEKALQTDAFKSAVTKIVQHANKELREGLLGKDEAKQVTEFISEIGKAWKEVGVAIDTKGFARSMAAFSGSVETLIGDVEKLKAVFGGLGDKINNDTAKVSGGFTVIGDAAGRAAVKVNKSIETMEAKLASIDAMLSEDYGKKFKFDANLEEQFYGIDEAIEKVETNIDQLSKKFNNMSASDKGFEETRRDLVQLYTEQIELYRKLELVDKEYTKKHSKDDSLLTLNAIDPKAVIGEIRTTIETIVGDAKRQLQDISTSTKTTKDGINIPIKLPSQVELVKTINKYVKSINDSDAIHGVRLKLDNGWLNDAANVIEDKTVRAYGDTPADYDKNTTDLVNKTNERFNRIANAIDEKLNGKNGEGGILETTKKWRQEMLKQFSFKSGDFEFQFNNTLIQELQSLFDDYGLQITVDKEYLANEIKQGLSGTSISLNGGTSSIDPKTMAMAVAEGLKAVLFGKAIDMPMSESPISEDIPKETEHIAKGIEKSALQLDLAEKYVKDVVDDLKAVANFAMKGSKGGIATKNKFDSLGLDLQRVSEAKSDEDVKKIIEEALLKKEKDEYGNVIGLVRDEFGNLIGNTLVDALSKFNGSSSKTIPALRSSLTEMFYMLQENTMTEEEHLVQQHNKEIFDYTRERFNAARSLQGLRQTAKQGDIPEVESIDKAIKFMSAIGGKTDALDALMTARQKLGNNTDEASQQEFQSVLDSFYKDTTKTFYNLKQQVNEAFDGTVYTKSKKGIIAKHVGSYNDFKTKIKDDTIIVDIKVHRSLNDTPQGDVKSPNTGRPSRHAEEALMRGQQADYITQREYEKDVLAKYKDLKYSGFKPHGATQNVYNLDTALAANESQKLHLEQEIQSQEAEKAKIDNELVILEQTIAELSERNQKISNARKRGAQERLKGYEATISQLSIEESMEARHIKDIEGRIRNQQHYKEDAEAKLSELPDGASDELKKPYLYIIDKTNNVLSDLTNELAFSVAKKNEIDARLKKAEKGLARTKNSAAILVPEELNRATSQKDTLMRKMDAAESIIITSKQRVSELDAMSAGIVAQKERNELRERALVLEGAIKKLEQDGASADAIEEKKAELLEVNQTLEASTKQIEALKQRLVELHAEEKELQKARQQGLMSDEFAKNEDRAKRVTALIQETTAELRSMGGLLSQPPEAKEYSDADRKTYALNEIESIDSDLITAKAAKIVVDSKIKEIDKKIADVNKWHLSAGYGRRELYRVKEQEVAKFKQSDYYHSMDKEDNGLQDQIAEVRAQAEAAVNDLEREIRDAFNQKVANAMLRDGLDPNSQEQTKQFLKSTRGKQYAEQLDAKLTSPEMETQKQKIWEQYEAEVKELKKKHYENIDTFKRQAEEDFRRILTSEDGVLKSNFKVQNDSGEWVDDIVYTTYKMIEDDFQDSLKDQKKHLEREYNPDEMQQTIDKLETDKQTAIEYGSISDKELLSPEIIQKLIELQTGLDKAIEKQVKKQEELNALKQAGVSKKDKSYKQAQKELDIANKQVERYNYLIENRKKLVQLRWDESKLDTQTSEEQKLNLTNQIAQTETKIENSLARQAELKEKIEVATDNEKAQLQRSLEQEEEKVNKWRTNVNRWQGRLQNVETAKSEIASAKTGEVTGGLIGVIKEALGDVNIGNVDLTQITEILQKILAVLTGGKVISHSNSAKADALATMRDLEKKYGGKPGERKSVSKTSDAPLADNVDNELLFVSNTSNVFESLSKVVRICKQEFSELNRHLSAINNNQGADNISPHADNLTDAASDILEKAKTFQEFENPLKNASGMQLKDFLVEAHKYFEQTNSRQITPREMAFALEKDAETGEYKISNRGVDFGLYGHGAGINWSDGKSFHSHPDVDQLSDADLSTYKKNGTAKLMLPDFSFLTLSGLDKLDESQLDEVYKALHPALNSRFSQILGESFVDTMEFPALQEKLKGFGLDIQRYSFDDKGNVSEFNTAVSEEVSKAYDTIKQTIINAIRNRTKIDKTSNEYANFKDAVETIRNSDDYQRLHVGTSWTSSRKYANGLGDKGTVDFRTMGAMQELSDRGADLTRMTDDFRALLDTMSDTDAVQFMKSFFDGVDRGEISESLMNSSEIRNVIKHILGESSISTFDDRSDDVLMGYGYAKHPYQKRLVDIGQNKATQLTKDAGLEIPKTQEEVSQMLSDLMLEYAKVPTEFKSKFGNLAKELFAGFGDPYELFTDIAFGNKSKDKMDGYLARLYGISGSATTSDTAQSPHSDSDTSTKKEIVSWIASMSEQARKDAVAQVNAYDKESVAKLKAMSDDELVSAMSSLMAEMDGLNKETVEYVQKQRELGNILNAYKEKSLVKDQATAKNGYINPKILSEKDTKLQGLGLYDKHNPITSNKATRDMFEVEVAQKKTKAKQEEVVAEKEITKEKQKQKKTEEKIIYSKEDYNKYKEAEKIANGSSAVTSTVVEGETGGIGSLAREDTLAKILEVLNAFKSDGVKTTGKAKGAGEEKTPKKTEAELIKERALKDKDAVLGIASSSKIKKKYEQLVKQLESETDLGKIKALAQKATALGFNIKKESAEWDYKTGSLDNTEKTRLYNIPNANAFGKRPETVRKSMEKLAQSNKFNPDGKQYEFLNFDGKNLSYQLTDIHGNVEKVTMSWSELNNQVAITSDKPVAKLDTLASKVKTFGEKFKNAVQMGYLAEDDGSYKEFLDKVTAIDTQATFEDVEKARNEALQAADRVTKQINSNKKLYTGTTEMNAADRQFGKLEQSGILEQGDLKLVEEYENSYRRIAQIHNDLLKKKNGVGLLDENGQKQLRDASLEAQKLGKELEKAYSEHQQLQQAIDSSGMYNGQKIGGWFKVEDQSTVYDQMVAKLKELGAEHIKVDRVRKIATGTIRHNNRTVSDLTVKYDELAGALGRYQKQERESLTGLPAFLNGFQKKFNSIMQYLTMTMSIHQVLAQLRRGVQYIKEIDLALTELRKVTDETEETYDKFLKTAAKTGERLGATISAVTEATATFAKLGYSMQQATEMAEAAIVYKNVGDNIASTEDAADSIISTMKGFGLEATESMAIVDKFNEVGE